MRQRETNHQLLHVTEALSDTPAPRIRTRSFTASMEVENRGDERARVRHATVTDIDGACGEAGRSFEVRTAALVRPGARRRIPVRFEISPTTPTGTYRFEVDIAGNREQMAIEVVPRFRLRVSPSILLVFGAGTSSHAIEVENRGNEAQSVVGNIAVPLDDELIICRALRGAAALSDELDEDEITVDRLAARAAITAREALQGAILGVRFTADLDPILPGQTAMVTVEIDTPSGLDARTRYTANIPFATATLQIVVVPSQVGGVVPGAAAGDPTAGGRSPAAGRGGAAAKTTKKVGAKAAKKSTKKSSRKATKKSASKRSE